MPFIITYYTKTKCPIFNSKIYLSASNFRPDLLFSTSKTGIRGQGSSDNHGPRLAVTEDCLLTQKMLKLAANATSRSMMIMCG
jgi:creatinine amidohydrolase/Fe(II)-dependent formamide hydrolase-like protein